MGVPGEGASGVRQELPAGARWRGLGGVSQHRSQEAQDKHQMTVQSVTWYHGGQGGAPGLDW